MRVKVIVAALLLTGIPALTFALSVSELDANVGLLFIGSAPPSGYGAPSPLVQTIGVSLPLRSKGPFFLEPSVEFFDTYYEWTGTRAVPTREESGIGFFTIGTLLSLQSGLLYSVSKSIDLGGALGVDFLIRFPFEFQNTDTDTSDSLMYFYTQGRFIYPETRFITRWHVTDGVTLAFTLRALYPLFHLWDGEGLPFYDQFMTALDIGFVIGLGGKPAAPPPASQPATQPPSSPASQPETAPAAAK
jgi:hypothetical protein